MKRKYHPINNAGFPQAVSIAALLVVSACAAPHEDRLVDQSVGSAEQPKVTAEIAGEVTSAGAEGVTVTGSRVPGTKSRLKNLVARGSVGRPLAMAEMRSIVRGQPIDRENYARTDKNPVRAVADDPVSTFSVDVDTGSYSLVRDRLNQGRLPHVDAVRTEELINYFSYDYPQPKGDTPFSVTTDALVTPWNKDTYLLRVGLQGKKMIEESRPAANLVLLLDVSGSMAAPDKLPLLTRSLEFMAGQLREDDRVSVVVYAGAAGLVLDVAKGTETTKIRNALRGLNAGGSTAGGAGIKLAYAKAKEAFIEGGINRVLLATDGDFNVGVSGVDELKTIIAANRESGISLSTLGFGDGNYNDHLMEQAADVGNGNYAYIDNFREAKKVLGDQLSATIHTIAKDVKIQVEFNPARVAEYRLIGYENRILADEDFTNDKVDAGEIGAGHSVTALYEVALVGGKGTRLPARRYDAGPKQAAAPEVDELAYVKLRYKPPASNTSIETTHIVHKSVLGPEQAPTQGLVHAAAVAAYGQLLSDNKYMGEFSLADAARLAASVNKTGDEIRAEFVALAESAVELKAMQQSGR